MEQHLRALRAFFGLSLEKSRQTLACVTSYQASKMLGNN